MFPPVIESVCSRRPGYIFLISVLVLGAIGIATVSSLLLLSWAAEQNGETVQESTQAFEFAQTCIERGLKSLRADPTYSGNETLSFTGGTCLLQHIGGYGNDHRTLCAVGISGSATRRVEVSLHALLPTTSVKKWQETTASTLCR